MAETNRTAKAKLHAMMRTRNARAARRNVRSGPEIEGLLPWIVASASEYPESTDQQLRLPKKDRLGLGLIRYSTTLERTYLPQSSRHT